jgi:hypothetical protein
MRDRIINIMSYARGVKLGGRPESLKNTELGRQRGTEMQRAKAAARAKDLAPVIEAIRAEGDRGPSVWELYEGA